MDDILLEGGSLQRAEDDEDDTWCWISVMTQHVCVAPEYRCYIMKSLRSWLRAGAWSWRSWILFWFQSWGSLVRLEDPHQMFQGLIPVLEVMSLDLEILISVLVLVLEDLLKCWTIWSQSWSWSWFSPENYDYELLRSVADFSPNSSPGGLGCNPVSDSSLDSSPEGLGFSLGGLDSNSCDSLSILFISVHITRWMFLLFQSQSEFHIHAAVTSFSLIANCQSVVITLPALDPVVQSQLWTQTQTDVRWVARSSLLWFFWTC